MTDPDEDKYCPSCGQEHDLDYDCEEDKMEEQRFINEIQELKATIEKLEGENGKLRKLVEAAKEVLIQADEDLVLPIKVYSNLEMAFNSIEEEQTEGK